MIKARTCKHIIMNFIDEKFKKFDFIISLEEEI